MMYNCTLQHRQFHQPFGRQSLVNFKYYVVESNHAQCVPRANSVQQDAGISSEDTPVLQVPRRSLLLHTAVITTLPLMPTQAAFANPLEDVARQLTRPSDITPLDAAVALLDARSTLRCAIVSSVATNCTWDSKLLLLAADS